MYSEMGRCRGHFSKFHPFAVSLTLRPRSSLSMQAPLLCPVQLCKPVLLACLPLSRLLRLSPLSFRCLLERRGSIFPPHIGPSPSPWLILFPPVFVTARRLCGWQTSSLVVLWFWFLRPDLPSRDLLHGI